MHTHWHSQDVVVLTLPSGASMSGQGTQAEMVGVLFLLEVWPVFDMLGWISQHMMRKVHAWWTQQIGCRVVAWVIACSQRRTLEEARVGVMQGHAVCHKHSGFRKQGRRCRLGACRAQLRVEIVVVSDLAALDGSAAGEHGGAIHIPMGVGRRKRGRSTCAALHTVRVQFDRRRIGHALLGSSASHCAVCGGAYRAAGAFFADLVDLVCFSLVVCQKLCFVT